MKRLIILSLAVLMLLPLAAVKDASAAAVTNTALAAGSTNNVTVNGNTVVISMSANVTGAYSLDDDGVTTTAIVLTCHAQGNRNYSLDSDGGPVAGSVKTTSSACSLTAPSATSADNTPNGWTAAIANTDT